MADASPLEQLSAFLSSQPAQPFRDRLDVTAEEAAPVLAFAAAHAPALHSLMLTMTERHTSFWLHGDFELYPAMFLRGKHPAESSDAVITDREMCVGRNGAGDLYIWNADSGRVRFVCHDEGWQEQESFDSLDEFVHGVMFQAVENADVDSFEDVDDAYLARFALALEIASDEVAEEEALDDEVRDLLRERDVLG